MRLVPTGLSLVLAAAHLLRADLPLVAVGCVGLICLLAVRRPWAAWTLQATLVLASLEWLRTLFVLAQARLDAGQPWVRLVVILGGVAAWTAMSAWLLESSAARRHFRRDTPSP